MWLLESLVEPSSLSCQTTSMSVRAGGSAATAGFSTDRFVVTETNGDAGVGLVPFKLKTMGIPRIAFAAPPVPSGSSQNATNRRPVVLSVAPNDTAARACVVDDDSTAKPASTRCGPNP